MSRFCAKLARLVSRSPLRRLCELAELGTEVVEMVGTAADVVVEGSPTPSEDTFVGCNTSPNASKPSGANK